MFQAQYLFKGPSSTPIFSPWMSRGGDNAIFTVDLIQKSTGTSNIVVQPYTKEADAAGDGSLLLTTITATAAGRFSAEIVGGLSDLVRYKFTITATNATDFAQFRMLPPVWFDSLGS